MWVKVKWINKWRKNRRENKNKIKMMQIQLPSPPISRSMSSHFLSKRWLTCLNPLIFASYHCSWHLTSSVNSSNFLGCIPSQSLVHIPMYSLAVWSEKQGGTWCCANTFQLQHQCVISTVWPQIQNTPSRHLLWRKLTLSPSQCNCYSQQIVAVICIL